MEQKQLDEIDDSYVGEEFINEDDFSDTEEEVKVEEVKSKKKSAKSKVAKKSNKVSKKDEEKERLNLEKENLSSASVSSKTSAFDNDFSSEEEEETKTSFNEDNHEDKKVEISSPVDPWAEDDDDSGLFKEVSTWKTITGIVVILLIFSVFTNGFNFNDGITGASTLSLDEAGGKALTYVNTYLLQPPFAATLDTSEDVGGLYKLTLNLEGESLETYVTKDGKLFFPQGYEILGDSSSGEVSLDPVEIAVGDAPVLGEDNAPVTIVEFSDFECPFCSKAYSTMKMVEANFVASGKVKIAFKHFPLSIHPEAENAALASECAREQGMFWEYHDTLFENQESLGVDSYKQWAADLGLDTTQFNECYESGKYFDRVNNNLLEGQQLGISGTPAFFINGKLISGAQPYDVFRNEINAALGTSAEPVTEVEVTPEVVPEVTEPVEVVEPVVEAPVEVVEPEVVTAPGSLKEFSLTAKKWLFEPQKVVVNQGDIVRMNINPVGLSFTFAVPEFGVSEDVSSATTLEFVADKAGTFQFECSSCEDWRGMTGELVVE